MDNFLSTMCPPKIFAKIENNYLGLLNADIFQSKVNHSCMCNCDIKMSAEANSFALKSTFLDIIREPYARDATLRLVVLRLVLN